MSTVIQPSTETPEVGVLEKKSGLMKLLWRSLMTGITMRL